MNTYEQKFSSTYIVVKHHIIKTLESINMTTTTTKIKKKKNKK